jgi:uncharacterized repeat protein (TIGR03803 family)
MQVDPAFRPVHPFPFAGYRSSAIFGHSSSIPASVRASVMKFAFPRLSLLFVFLLIAVAGGRAMAGPEFMVGTTSTSADPDYNASPFDSVPVGKSLVLPIVVSGTGGPIAYTASSASSALIPVIKTGYPVMTIGVSSTGISTAFSAIYPFTGGTDGGAPYAGLYKDSDGFFYGTTETDGSSGYGTVYQITTSGSVTTLYAFTGGTDGANPYAPLVAGTSADLYGTTETSGSGGAGTVFQITTSGTLTTLYSFTGGNDGGHPYGALVQGTGGLLYGTTETDGSSSYGTVFQITETGSLSTLYAFTDGTDGGNPYAGVIVGNDGDLYGTTTTGGAGGHGTVFKLSTSGSLNTLYAFTDGTDGGNPVAGVDQASDEKLYGTTETGGSGYGTIYQLTTTGTFATLYAFTDGTDGANPYAPLVQGTDDLLYGAASTGGTNSAGTLFRITTSGSFASLYSLNGANDGGNPRGGLVLGSNGDFYGTAVSDGTDGHGTVFQLAPPTGAFSGTMTFALFRDMAPVTTGYIAGFAQAGYYNGVDFFRITNLGSSGESEFIAQGGDPTNTGTGSPGFSFDNELSPSLIFTGKGQLAMANAGIDQSSFHGTNGSQFFFTEGPIRALDFGYTIFGQLLTGFDVMQQVLSVPLQSDGSSPVAPVIMNSVSVSEDDNDAILLVSADGYVPNGATIKVSATDQYGNKVITSSSGTSLSINVSTPNVDTVNDPPIIKPDSNYNTLLHQSVSFPIRSQDLEFDYLLPEAFNLSQSAASISLTKNVVTVAPRSFDPITDVAVGLAVFQPYVSTGGSAAIAVDVGLGAGKLTPLPALFTGTADGQLSSGTAGTFLCSQPGVTGSNYTATINWGDGVVESGTGNVAITPSARIPTEFNVTYTGSNAHTYANPGIYPLTVTVEGTSSGLVQVQSTADIGPGPIYAFGRSFSAPKGKVDCLVATFTDSSFGTSPGDYQATINWGDGSVTLGNGVVHGGNGTFEVYGKHTYAAGTTYPVDVTITNEQNPANSTYAWSSVTLSGVGTRQPPFSQSHIVAQIGNPGFNGLDVDEEVTLFNSGNLPSGNVTLKFYLSSTPDTDPISSNAIPLTIGGASSYTTPSIPVGNAIEGSVSDILLPSTVTSQGKYLIMQVITSDPIGSHMDYPRVVLDPNPLLE